MRQSQIKTFNLPDDFIKISDLEKDEVIIRHYLSDHNSLRNKIVLNRNMINLLISGKKTIIYPESTVTAQQGEMIILSTGNILTSEIISDQNNFSSVIIYFNNEVLDRFWVKYGSRVNSPNSQIAQSPFLKYTQDEFILHYANSLLLLLNGQVGLSAEIKQIKLEELLLYLMQADITKLLTLQMSCTNKDDLNLKKVVEKHIGHPTTVEELAFLCNMSTSTFKRNFNRIYNDSPQQWLLNKKLQYAAALLRLPSESPSAVYLKVGYKNHSSFSQAFRQLFGQNPSEYQAQHLGVHR